MTYTGRWFPEMPPMLDGETADAYTDRLTGADKADRIPYDHRRYRECSLGFHETCSDRAGTSPAPVGCQCPCHAPGGMAELRLWKLEESLVAVYAVASGRLKHSTWSAAITAGSGTDVAEIIVRRPQLALWYLNGEKVGP